MKTRVAIRERMKRKRMREEERMIKRTEENSLILDSMVDYGSDMMQSLTDGERKLMAA
jgi:hypothetical protein